MTTTDAEFEAWLRRRAPENDSYAAAERAGARAARDWMERERVAPLESQVAAKDDALAARKALNCASLERMAVLEARANSVRDYVNTALDEGRLPPDQAERILDDIGGEPHERGSLRAQDALLAEAADDHIAVLEAALREARVHLMETFPAGKAEAISIIDRALEGKE